jgi:hypothetical protein
MGLFFFALLLLAGQRPAATPDILHVTALATQGTGPAVTLAWDPNVPTDNVTSYRVYWGSRSGIYPNVLDVGNVTQATIPVPGTGTFFFTVTAFNANNTDPTPKESPKAPEVSIVISAPECSPPLGAQAVSIFVTKLLETTGRVGSKTTLYFQLASASAVTRIVVRLNDQVVGNPVAGVDAGGIWFTSPLVPGDYTVAVDATNAYGCGTVQTLGPTGKPMVVTVKP